MKTGSRGLVLENTAGRRVFQAQLLTVLSKLCCTIRPVLVAIRMDKSRQVLTRLEIMKMLPVVDDCRMMMNYRTQEFISL
jgi:hypothetical protein